MPKNTAAPMPHPLPPSRRGGMDGLRELTVTTLHRASARRGGREEAVPYLRISRRWLEQYGESRADDHESEPRRRESHPRIGFTRPCMGSIRSTDTCMRSPSG
jgi:hypothetical protein